MSKDIRIAFQKWLISKGCYLGNSGADGVIGKDTKLAMYKLFADKKAKAITDDQLKKISLSLGDVQGTARIRAVAVVESGGSGWFDTGHVKILYERHKFYQYNTDTTAPKSTFFNFPTGGNYTVDDNKNDVNDNWEKLFRACEFDPLAAFMSISMGKFQVMGFHYKAMGFNTPYDMLFSMVSNEEAHYVCLVKYIMANNLQCAYLTMDSSSSNCIPFAKGYNGSGYAKFSYDKKLALNITQQKSLGY